MQELMPGHAALAFEASSALLTFKRPGIAVTGHVALQHLLALEGLVAQVTFERPLC